MKKIFKYTLSELAFSPEGEKMLLPKFGKVIKVGVQENIICIWVLFNFNAPVNQLERFHVVGTGQETEAGWDYLETVFVGPFVWHIFKEE